MTIGSGLAITAMWCVLGMVIYTECLRQEVTPNGRFRILVLIIIGVITTCHVS